MAFQEAFNVKPKGKETVMEINANAFTIGNQLETQAAEKIKFVQENLDWMQKRMKKDLNADEMKVAWLAIERELEADIPSWVPSSYRNERTSWQERSDLIMGQILGRVEQYIANRLEDVIKITDDKSWTWSVSKKEAGEILEALAESRGKTVSPQEIQAFKERYVHPNLIQQGASAVAQRSSMRRAADEAMKER